ncbi:hypothetical protein [Streptomyces sp. YIM 98790]|uniref:hypothetical protein n=1 Tax=Streptomyces sp. YIM 98790 TaxID=2689077 RepID=UPI00140AD21A|nr:hypothetical protein [Streptomyces sp. YIM 98790]
MTNDATVPVPADGDGRVPDFVLGLPEGSRQDRHDDSIGGGLAEGHEESCAPLVRQAAGDHAPELTVCALNTACAVDETECTGSCEEYDEPFAVITLASPADPEYPSWSSPPGPPDSRRRNSSSSSPETSRFPERRGPAFSTVVVSGSRGPVPGPGRDGRAEGIRWADHWGRAARRRNGSGPSNC